MVDAEEDDVLFDGHQLPHGSNAKGSGKEMESFKQALESVKTENVELREQLDSERLQCMELW